MHMNRQAPGMQDAVTVAVMFFHGEVPKIRQDSWRRPHTDSNHVDMVNW